MARLRIGAMLTIVTLLTGPGLYAQQGTSEISGKVTDEQGAVLPGVSILVTNEATGVFREITSSPEGTYFASQLVPGRYKIVAKLAGFRSLERAGLVLQVGNTLSVNLTLPIGSVEENVTVTAQTPSSSRDERTCRRQPRHGGVERTSGHEPNYFSTVALLPGVQFSPSNQMGNDTIVAGGQTSQNSNVSG